VHGNFLEFFGANHRHEQVDEEQQGNGACNQCFHVVLLELCAEADISCAHRKEGHHHTNVNQVIHRSCFCDRTSRSRSFLPYDDLMRGRSTNQEAGSRRKDSVKTRCSIADEMGHPSRDFQRMPNNCDILPSAAGDALPV
jgi:hypothetical protein